MNWDNSLNIFLNPTFKLKKKDTWLWHYCLIIHKLFNSLEYHLLYMQLHSRFICECFICIFDYILLKYIINNFIEEKYKSKHSSILMRPYISPVRSTILALKNSPTQKKKTRIPCRRHRCGAGQIPSEGQVKNILVTLECQRVVNYAYLDSRGHWGFYSSGVLPPFLVTQVVSLQNSSFKNPKSGGQVILP